MNRPSIAESKQRVLIAAGSSGGHLYPALAFAEAMAEEPAGFEPCLITGRERIGPGSLSPTDSMPILRLKEVPYRGIHSLFWPPFILGFLSVFVLSWRILKSLKPKPVLAVGFGGLPSVPVILCAHFQGLKTLIHEPNALLGMANRLLSFWADETMFAFPLECKERRGIKSGMPLRSHLKPIKREEALRALGLSLTKRTFGVMGGSQGSRALNQGVRSLWDKAPAALSTRWQMIHLTGPADGESFRDFYKERSIDAAVFSYLEDTSLFYCAADLILCRAGAGTLHELAFFRKGAVLVPYPGSRGHQTANARFLSERGAAILLPEEELSPERLVELLEAADRDPGRFVPIGEHCARLLGGNGTRILVDRALALLGMRYASV